MADLDFTAAAARGRERLEAPDVTPPLEGAPVPPAPAAPPASLEPAGGAPRLPAGPKVPDFAGAAARGAERLGQEEDLRAGMAAYRATQTDLPPEKGIEIAQLARATGKPVQFVADNLDELRRSVDADRLKAALLESPVLQEMLLDPAKAGVLKDQIADANTWEWWFGRWDLKPHQISGPDGKPLLQFPMPELALGPAWARAGVAGVQEQRITYLANKQMLGVTTSEEDKDLADLEAKYGNRDFGANNPVTKGVVGGVKMAPYMLGSAVARVAGGAAAAPAGPGGIAVGQYAGGAAWDFYQNVGPLYRQLRTLKRGDGTPLLTDEEARSYAVPISAGISAFTSGLGGVALRGFPLTKELLEKATRKGVEKAFVEVGGEQAVKSFLTRYGTHVAAGGAMMAVQGGGNAAAAELAKGQHGEEWSVRPVVDAAAHAFLTGIQDMSLIAAWGPGREYLRERGLRTVVDAEAARYQGIAEQAAASPILERLKEHPDQAQAILGKLSLGQSAFADPVGWDTYWTAKKFNPRDVAAEIAGDGGKAYDQAKAGTAPDLVLPLDRYLARFGKTEHMLGLQPDVKLASDGLTPRQARVREELNAKLDAAELPPAEKDAFVEQLDGFEAAMVEQLRGRGDLEAQSLAKISRKALSGFALKEKLQPADILQKYPLKFEVFGQPRPGASTTPPRPTAPAPAAAEVPSATLAKELGDLDPGIQKAIARGTVAAALRGDRAALGELARGEAAVGDTAKAWALLKKGEAAPGLEDLVQAAREAAVARGEGEIPKAIRAKLEKIDAQIRKTELERQKGAVVEAAKAKGGDVKAAAKRAKADLEARLREPLKAPSSTRTERVVLAKDADGLNFAAAHPRGEAAPEGGQLRDVKLPTWLPMDAFLEDRAAWDWTFAAVGGPEAPEQLAKLVHGYMALAMQEFDPKAQDRVIHQAWTVARLAQGKGGKKLSGLRKALADWAKTPEAERVVDPIPEKAWGTVLWRASKDTERITLSRHSYERKVDVFEKWLSATKGELDPARATFNERPPAWYGKPEDGAAPHPLDAKLEELRAQRATLEAEGKAAAVAGAKPKILLDREAVARALGAETDTAFRNLTEPGGLAPDELAKRLGWASGDAMLAAMAREHRDTGGKVAIAQLDTGPVVVDLGQPRDVPPVRASSEAITGMSEALRAAHPDIKFDLTGGAGGVVVLSRIVVPEDRRSTGLGSRFMLDLARLADRRNLVLAATPSSDFGGTKSRIVEWNKRFSFVENKGTTKDLAISETMYRVPQDVPLVEGNARTATPEFKAWFGDSKVVDAEGVPVVAFHGTKRPDRVGTRFRKDRATSGPMAFFTDAAELASNYAMSKADTSLEAPADYSAWFKMKVGRSTVELDRAWWHLTPEERAVIAEKLPHVVLDDATGEYRYDANETGLADARHWDYEIRQAGGNVLKAAKEIWLNGGSLVDSEREFLEVLRLGGAGDKFEFDSPWAESPAVYPVFLSIKNPLDTSAIPPATIAALEQAAKRRRAPRNAHGADLWDKATRDPKEWIRTLKADAETGTNSHAWTSIPDWVTETLQRLGYDGIRDRSGKGGGDDSHTVWIPFDETQVKSVFNRGAWSSESKDILRQDRRGEIQFVPPDAAGKPVEFNARLLEGADESTAAHELGHWLGLVLGQIAGEPGASAEHQALYRTALDHMGYKDHAERLAALAEQAALAAKVQADKATDADRARLRVLEGKEEKLSFAFEQVLAEGKAPSPELAPVFARYKLWLNRIYRGIENLEARYEKDYGQKLNLSDEVRGMFQRLLASEEQIAQAEREYDAAAFRAVLKELDPESADEVEKAAAARRAAAEARLYQVLTEESRREQDQFFAGERDRLRADVESELDVQPVYQALRWLREGALPEGRLPPHELKAEDGKPRLLDRAELIERYGADFVRTLPPGLTTRDPARAVPADILAEGFGFKTGDELVRTLQKTPSRAEEVQRQVQDRLEALYPTLKNHPEKLAEAAVDAQHTPERAVEIMQGIRILTRKLLPEMAAAAKAIDLGKVQETAARLVGERSIADASPGRAALAERKASKETLELLAKASREPNEKNRKELAAAAWDAYQVQLLNHYVYLEAKRVREEGDTLRGKMQRLAGDANMRRLTKAGDEYVDRVKEVLGTIEFSASASMAAVHRRGEYVAAAKGDGQAAGAMLAWLEKQRALNRDPYVPQAVLDLLGRTTHWKDLRLDQLQDLHDTVESISHVAHTKDRLKTRAGEVEKTKAIEEMAARLQDTFGTTGIVVSRNTVAWKRRALEGWRKFRAGTIGAEELFRELDGGDPNGPFTRLLWRPVSESADAWNALVLKTTKPILEHLEKLTKEDLKRWRDNRFTVKGQTYTLEEAMAVLLNSMNDSNRNKLEKGWSGPWVDKYGLERWDAGTRMEFVKQLHEKDADLAQQIIDSLETLWPEMEALEKRVQGVAPPKIKAKAFTLWFNPDGTSAEPNAPGAHAKEYRGGYYPVVFDHRFSSAGSRQEENAHALTVGGLFQSGAERAITPHGHLNKRVEDFARPVDLSLAALFRHLPHATKDIAMREALIGAHGIITDSRFRAEAMKTAGEPALKFLDKWILDAANELVVKDGGEGAFLSAVGATRRGVTGAVFSLNAAQALQNLTGVMNAMTRVDPTYMQKGISKILSERAKAIDEIAALSPYMASRAVTSDKDLAQNFRETLGKTGPGHRAQEIGMWGFQASDRVVANATWWGAYEQALAGKVEGVRVDQAEAVAWANSVVRLSLMSGRTIDLAAIQRHQLGKFLTMFYGWGRAQLDQLIGAGTDARVAWNDGQKLRALRRLTRVFFWVAAGAVLSDLVTGKAPTDDDEDGKVDGKDWSKWAVRRAAMQPLSGVPLVGQVVRAAIDDRKNVSLSPTERVYSGAAQTLSSGWKVGKAWVEDDDYQEELRNFGQHAIETAATVGGLPVAQAKATLGYWMDEDRNRSAPVGEDVLGTLYGKRRKGTMLGAVYEE